MFTSASGVPEIPDRDYAGDSKAYCIVCGAIVSITDCFVLGTDDTLAVNYSVCRTHSEKLSAIQKMRDFSWLVRREADT